MMKSKFAIYSLVVLWITVTGASGQEALLQPGLNRPDTLLLDSLYSRGIELLEERKAAECSLIAEKLLQESNARDYRHGRAGSYYLLGRVSEMEGQLPAALRNYFMAVREYEWMKDETKLAELYSRMGDIYRSTGIYGKAAENYDRAVALSASRPPMEQVILLEKLAETYFLLQEYDTAVIFYKDLLTFYQDYQPDLVTATLLQVTACLYQMERYQEAVVYNEQALRIALEKPSGRRDEVEALNSLGYNYKYLKDDEKSAGFFAQAADIAGKEFPAEEIYPVTLVNYAIALQNLGEASQSLDIFFKALEVAGDQRNYKEEARIMHLLSYVYFIEQDYYNAGIYNLKAMGVAQGSGYMELLQNIYQMASLISTSLYDYEMGMIYYHKFLSLRDSLQTRADMSRQELAQQEYTVERTEKELAQLLYERELQGLEVKNLRIEGERRQQELELLQSASELQAATIRNQELEKNRALQELLLAEERLAAEVKDREIQDLKVQQQLQESELKRNELEQIRQQQEITVLTKERELDALTIQKIRARNAFLAGIVLLSIIILILLIRGLRYARKTNRVLSDQRNKIQQQKEALESQYEIIKTEREKSDKLLLNILPEQTASELKEKGRAVPRQYSKVTVLFTDFVGFTMVAEKMTPEELIGELDLCFMEFDRIIGEHNLEKIKTIGDAYMCAGGIPAANETNPIDAVEAALEIKSFMDKTREARKKDGREYWQLRIGIHTGEVVAGVVGRKKFAYDIWGDAVNTASRMESSGEPGRVNISGSTYALVKDRYLCTYRGKVYAKNKGEIDMYFVDEKR
jgi:class 3 adenylate cyclase/tetratricopeptide (TPR) repeat protein